MPRDLFEENPRDLFAEAGIVRTASPVEAQLSQMAGKIPSGYQYNESGQLEPTGKGIIQPGLEQPVKPATGVLDYITRVIPESGYRTVVGLAEMPYQVIKSYTDPIIEGIVNPPKTPLRKEELYKKSFTQPLTGVVEPTLKNLEGVSRFVGEPLGIYGWEALKKRWATDPVGSVVGILPLIGNIFNIAKARGIKPQEAMVEIAKLSEETGQPISALLKAENRFKPAGGLKPRDLFEEQAKAKQEPYIEPTIFKPEEVQQGTPVELGGLQTIYETLMGEKKVVDKLPKYARSVNLERQNIPEPYKQFEVKVAEEVGPKKVQTWDQTGKISEEILSDYNRAAKILEKAKKGEGLTAPEILAARQVNVNAIDRLKEMAETSTPEQFAESYNFYRDTVFKATSDASSEIGRALNIHKKEVSVDRLATAFAKLERNLNSRELEEFKKINFENPIEVKQFVKRLGDPRLKDYFYEFWYNSILSGIPTHLVNVASNTFWSAFQIPHRALMAGIDTLISPLKGSKREYFFREIPPMLAGYKSGFSKGAAGAWEAVKTGKTTEFETKWSREIGDTTLGAFERSPHESLRKVAPVVSAPTRALRAMDVWANSMAFDAEIRSLAKKEVLQRKGLSTEAGQTLYSELIKNPTESMMKDAGEFSKYSTFMDDPGKFTQWIIQGRDVIPGGRLVVPFVNTIANLFKRGIEMTPVLGPIKAKGKLTTDLLAKQIEGSILALYIMHKLKDGQITAGAPRPQSERDAFFRSGKLPWAIKLGDNWYQYRRAEPFNTVIASVATAYENINKALNKEKEGTEIFADTADGIVSNLLDSSYLQGITNLLDKYGQRKGMIQRTFASFVPFSGFWRSVNRAYEATTQGEPKVRDTGSWQGAFSQVIPGLGENLPPKMNVWGKEISIPGGVLRQWLPYKYSEELNDPTEKELARLNIYPGFPKQKLTVAGEKIELSDEEYRDYCLYYGSIAKELIDGVIQTETYRVLDDDKKSKLLDSTLTKVRNKVLLNVKKEHLKTLIEEEENGLP
jgi:hypothetical protein